MPRSVSRFWLVSVLVSWVCGTAGAVSAGAQTAPTQPGLARLAAGVEVNSADQPATLIFFNRPIAVFRARVLGRPPSERAAAATRVLYELVAQHNGGPVESHSLEGAVLINVGTRVVFGLAAQDADELSGETLDSVSAATVAALQQALTDAIEARTAGSVARSFAVVGAGLFLGFMAIWGLVRAHRAIEGRLDAISRRALATTGGATSDTLHTSRLIAAQRGLATAITSVLGIVVIYWITTFVLRQLPYTRVWGESMRGFLLATFARLGLDVLRAIPGLFTAALIFLAVRFAVRLVDAWFNAVERGRIRLKWMYPETAVPSRRLVTILLWVFGIIVAYPYLPGSQTEAFKGVSVFLGLMLTFGSSGIVNQLMSGFMITYSRALRPGNYVKIGDVTGTVTHLGILSTKIKTARREEVTIPNAVVVSQTATDYTRFSETEGVLTPTSVTIGYDTPWRQVHSLLLLAAERTPGLRAEPKPFVVQAALEDFYVKYTLLVSLERQDARVLTLNALHGHIQDVFNEHGVQIMSPHYEKDPKAPKIVATKDWFAPPARPEDR